MMYEANEWPKACPQCKSNYSKVDESYMLRNGKRRRLRRCDKCNNLFYTLTHKDPRFI